MQSNLCEEILIPSDASFISECTLRFDPICPGCNKPMIDGQVFNGLLKCHWDCQDVVRAQMGDRNADDLIQFRINKRLAMDGITCDHPLFAKLGGKVV